VLLCDHYYFGFSLLAGGVLLARRFLPRGEPRPPGLLRNLALFAVASAATCGPIVGSLVASDARDPLVGSHDARAFSLDLLAPFVPGSHWRFASLTEGIWARLGGGALENSVHLGSPVLFLLGWAIVRRRELRLEGARAWWTIALLAFALALGPGLRLAGKEIVSGVLPYAALEAVLPALRLGGTPVRWIVLVQLCAALIAAAAFRDLWSRGPRWRVLGLVLLAILAFEILPKPLPRTSPEFPGYVRALKNMPADGAVLDLFAGPGRALYHQIEHGKPLAFGYISRLPTSAVRRLERLAAAASTGNARALCREFGVRYLVVAASVRDRIGSIAEVVYADEEAAIGRVKCP
jgi:hypothetical protein